MGPPAPQALTHTKQSQSDRASTATSAAVTPKQQQSNSTASQAAPHLNETHIIDAIEVPFTLTPEQREEKLFKSLREMWNGTTSFQ
jgi:hypothetical protein